MKKQEFLDQFIAVLATGRLLRLLLREGSTLIYLEGLSGIFVILPDSPWPEPG